MNNFKFIVLLVTILGSSSLFAQTPIYNVNFGTLNFGVTTTNNVSTPPLIITRSGQTQTSSAAYSATTANTAGTQVLYRNIITIGGQVIDCIVTNVEGTLTFDQTGTNADVNNMFVPYLNSSNTNPYSDFLFEFVTTSTSSGITTFTPVLLDNVVLNVYDLDRDASSGSGNVKNRVRISTTNIITNQVLSTIAATIVTDPAFWDVYQISNSNNNPDNINTLSSIVDDDHRLRATFSNMSSLLIQLGGQFTGTGTTTWGPSDNTYYLAFSPGANFTVTPTNNEIVVDLNGPVSGTNGIGINNTVIVNNNSPNNFTISSTTNITKGTTTTLVGIDIVYPVSQIINGSNETLIINGATTGNTNNIPFSPIPLNFTTAPSPTNFWLSGIEYTVTYSILNGDNTIAFTQLTNGTNSMDLTRAEALLDAFQYRNTAITNNTVGDRVFDVSGIGTYLIGTTTFDISSPIAKFIASIPTPLPVNVISFTGKAIAAGNQLNWTVAQEIDFSHYEVLRSDNGRDFNAVGTVYALNNSLDMKSYSFVDADAKSDLSYYKLRLVDNNGSVAYSSLVVVSRTNIVPTVSNVFPNPASTQLNVELNGVATDNMTVTIQDLTGKILYQAENVSAQSSVYSFDINTLNRGVYIIRIQDEMGQTSVSRFSVSK